MRRQLTLTTVALGTLSLCLFLFKVGTPAGYIYDEYSYVSAARSYLHGGGNTNPEHPPFAKFLIAGGMLLVGDNPVGWRFSAALFGSLTLVAIFLWVYLLVEDYGLALTAAVLSLLNNFLFVMSRVAMLDVFYFAFVMWGLLAFTAGLTLDLSIARRRALMFVTGLLFGLGIACKWNAVVTLAVVGVVVLYLLFRDSRKMRQVGIPVLVLSMVIVPAVSYALAYLPLFLELHRPFAIGSLVAMNLYIWQWHVACPGNPALHSPWYDWFFRSTPERGLRYLMGNFVVVWGGLAALLACARRLLRGPALAESLVVLLYAANLLQWVIIPQKLTCYYYYYPPAMFLGVAIVLVLWRMPRPTIYGVRISFLLIIAAAGLFLFCYPKMTDLQAPFDCALGCWP